MRNIKSLLLVLIILFLAGCSSISKKNIETEKLETIKTTEAAETKTKTKTKTTKTKYNDTGDIESIEVIDQEIISETEEKKITDADKKENEKTISSNSKSFLNSWKNVIARSFVILVIVLAGFVYYKKK
jgi:uncharacterized protein YceK